MGGFYFDPGNQDPGDEKPGMRDALALTIAVFQTLALPMALILGVVGGLLALLWIFFYSALIAGGIIALGVGALVARGIWELRHPPKLP